MLIMRARAFHSEATHMMEIPLDEPPEWATILMHDRPAKSITACVFLGYGADNPASMSDRERRLPRRRQMIRPIISRLW